MKKLLFVLLLLSQPVWALVPPRKYMADSSCPQDAPFRECYWNNYKHKKGGYYKPSGECISCDTTKALMLVDKEDCDLCPNRTMESVDTLPGFYTSNYCRLKECPPNKPFYEEDWNWSGCKNCQDEPKHIKKEECEQCPNMRWVEGVGCAPDKPGKMYYSGTILTPDGHESPLLGGSSPYSIGCDSHEWQSCKAVNTSEQECQKCPYTYMKDGFCHMDGWKKINACPKGHTRNACGFCIPCSEVNGDKLLKEECEKCPLHVFNNGFCNRTGSPDPTLPLVTHEDHSNGHVSEYYYSCDKESPVSTTKAYCDKCPNREYVERKNLCVLKECPAGEVRDIFYNCRKCDSILFYQPLRQEACSKCSNLIFKDGQCLYKTSPDPERPLVYMREDRVWWPDDSEESTYRDGRRNVWVLDITDCDKPDAVTTRKEYCDVCPNREMKDDECILKH